MSVNFRTDNVVTVGVSSIKILMFLILKKNVQIIHTYVQKTNVFPGRTNEQSLNPFGGSQSKLFEPQRCFVSDRRESCMVSSCVA